MTIWIINGLNLNLTGKREPSIYGNESFESYIPALQSRYPHTKIAYMQSNHEGQLIDWLQEADDIADGVVLNAGGYTHTSIAIADAIAAIKIPVVEVHISNIYHREPFRHHSYLSSVCKHTIIGHGLAGYEEAIQWLNNKQTMA